MSEFVNGLLNTEISVGFFIFILGFTLVVSFFHYIILTGLYHIKLTRYFFGLYPLVILLVYMVRPSAVILVFFVIIVLTFVLAFIGMLFVSPFLLAKKNAIDKKKQQEKISRETSAQSYRKITQKKEDPTWVGLKKVLEGLVLFMLFAVFEIMGNGVYFFLLLFIGIVVKAFLLSSKEDLFSLQRNLPTSKIRSVAMGLAEIEGKIKIDQAMKSRIEKRPCAGYYYEIQDIIREDGKEKYITISIDYAFNPFYLQDDTGSIKIIPDKLLLLNFKETIQYLSNGQRAVEYVLEEDGQNYLMIGEAAYQGNETIFRYDENREILSIAPSTEVEKKNKERETFFSFMPYLVILLLWIVFVLLSDVELSQTGLKITPPEFLQKFLGKTLE